MDRTVASAWHASRSRAAQCVGVRGSLLNRVRQANRVGGGAAHHCASPSASERRQDGVLGGCAADTESRSFGATRPHASRSPPHTACAESPGERGAQPRRASRQGPSEQGHGPAAREERIRRTQEAETATERVRREAKPLVDATSVCATKSNTHQERGGRDKKRQKNAQKGLTNAAT
jgi:hypothetical protein